MLVLQRRRGERILLDNGVTIELIQVRGQAARIGVSAPPQVKILREELMGVMGVIGPISPMAPISPIV